MPELRQGGRPGAISNFISDSWPTGWRTPVDSPKRWPSSPKRKGSAPTSFAGWLRDHGRGGEGRELLAPIHAWFIEAKALLDELA